MSKFFQKLKKIITAKKTGKFFSITKKIIKKMAVFLIMYIITFVVFQKTVKLLDNLIIEEQKRDLTRFEDKIIVAENHINELQGELDNIKVGRWVKLSEKQKRDLLKITWELRKDSWRIESALINHENDWSINLYPRNDEQIESKFKNYWPTHILIDRVIDDTEGIIYSLQGIDKFQLQKLREDLGKLKKVFRLR